MSLFQFPSIRKSYSGLQNPLFSSDLVAAGQTVYDGLIASLGLQPTDFAIITGLVYTTGTPNTYTTGVIYFNGGFYYVGASFAEGQYLLPTTTDTNPETFGDSISRNTYTLFQANPTSTPTGATPAFAGNMNAYRIDNRTLKAAIASITADYVTSTILATALSAYVAKAGATMTGALILNADPTTALQAATKQYVDNKGLSNCIVIAFYTDSSSTVTIQKQSGTLGITGVRITGGVYRITHNIGNTNYFVTFIGKNSTSANAPKSLATLSNDYFEITLSDDASLNNGDFYFQIWAWAAARTVLPQDGGPRLRAVTLP